MVRKNYSEEQEKMARFAKAMGHPARIAILQFLASQECCFFGDIWGIERSGFFNGREKWAKGFENQRV